ncbi:adenylate/guanylate cyclase domain-containing protein [Candidatus Halobeggiatoa sp. HSG11]|nr:adenylate/guanylate cyclase domain-containing protein [Candidatus Halobeggiatoa sp. HSG11]
MSETIFQEEEKILKKTNNIIEQCTDNVVSLEDFKKLSKDYKKLLKQTKFLVKMSDKQQSQLTTITEKLQSSNVQLKNEAEHAIKANEEKLAQFLDAVSIGVFVLDAKGNFYYANQKAKEILGNELYITGKLPEIYQAYTVNSNTVYPNEHRPIIKALQGKFSTVDNMEVHRGTNVIPIEVWGTPIFNECEELIYAMTAFQDITERKKAEEERINFIEELAGLNRAYERFVPRQFLSLLEKKSIVDITLGEHVEKEMTILFADIRDFTSLSEKMTPQENFNFINSYLSQMDEVIHQHRGFIDKYIGDAVMALFHNADDAVCGAIAMLKRLINYNDGRVNAGYEAIKIGIGVNTGALMIGTVGGRNRMDGTVISDSVNLASRVEGLTKIYGTQLLISEHTYEKLADPNKYMMRIIDATKVQGKSEEVTVYEVFDADPPETIALKNATIEDFEPGFVLYNSDAISDAKLLFEKVLKINPNDKAAQVHLEDCERILSMTVPENLTILIVDDISENIKVLSRFLTGKKFKVLIAKNGRDALKTVDLVTPHLVLLDIMMPKMSGFEVCERLKSNPKTENIPVIFMTALTEAEDKIKGFELGAVDYITKPFQKEEVLVRIQTHLHLSHLQQKAQWYIKKANEYLNVKK